MNRFFSVDDFKKWIEANESGAKDIPQRHELFGTAVESKIGMDELVEKIKMPSGDLDNIAECFYECGGTIVKPHGKYSFLIETDSGTFVIKKCYVTKD